MLYKAKRRDVLWTLKKKTKLKLDLIAHFADLEPLEQENVESFTAVLRW